MTQEDTEELKKAFEEESTSAQEETKVETEVEETKDETEENPLKEELEKFKSKKTPQEKAKDSLYFNAQKAKELGLDPAEILGIKPKEEIVDEDEKPVTRKELEELLLKSRQETATKSAVELANEIKDETERELTLYHISNTIKSTGDPKEDLRLARALTNDVKNRKILEEVERKPQAKTHSSASGGTAGNAETQIELTVEEKAYLATGVVTKEEILQARQGKTIA